MTGRVLLPSDLLRLARVGLLPASRVAVDTETSGLFPDQGARISTVSVAWIDTPSHEWLAAAFPDAARSGYPDPDYNEPLQVLAPNGIQTWAVETIDQWDSEPVISFAWPFDQGVAGTGKPEDRGQGTLWADTENLPESEFIALIAFLELVGASHGLTMHHAKFDCQMFRVGVRHFHSLQAHCELIDYVHVDTQNGADLLTARNVIVMVKGEPRPSSSLKPTASYYWGDQETDEKKVIAAYLAKHKLPSGRWDLMPWDVIAKYADQDARLTIRLDLRQELDLSSAAVDGWLDGKDGRMTAKEAIARRLETSKMLYRVERRGLPFSVPDAHRAINELGNRAARLKDQLPFKPATLPMAKHYFFGQGVKNGVVGQDRTPYTTTPTGAPQMDSAVVTKMVRDGWTGAETWRDIQKLDTVVDKWYAGWSDKAGDDNRLRMSVKQNGTVSGRFSAEGIQLHAIPHDYKLQNFQILNGIPSPRDLIGMGVPEGYRMWELDLQNAELRVAALFAGCKRMLDLIESGADLHADAARELFHVSPESPNWGEMRQVAKRFNFSAIFGIGWAKLQMDIEDQTGIFFSRAELEELLKRWHGLYPEFKRAIYSTMEVIEARARKNQHGNGWGWITLANGERRWFLPGEDWHKGFNQRVQPSLGQFAIDWWLGTEQYILNQLGDEPIDGVGRIGMVLMVHDSMVLLLPDDEVGQEMVDYAIRYGEDLWRQRFPGVPGGVDASEWANHS